MQKIAMLFLALLAAPAVGSVLRGHDSNSIEKDFAEGAPAKPADIKAKWDKMDDFLGTVFTMACKMKNGKDISGLAAEKLDEGEVEGAEGYAAEVKSIQAANVRGFKRTCGMIISESKKKCREGCATRWNAMTAAARDDCDDKCVEVYANFERSCKSKADNLVKVYAQKSEKAAAQKQCYEGHCKEFPMVWMIGKAKDQKTEVTKQCTARCSKANVLIGCQHKWADEVGLITKSVTSDCQDKTGVKKCIDGKVKEAGKQFKKCQKDTAATCDKALAACKKKGKTDKNFKDAGKFCADRRKMCQKQADANCLKENNGDLNAGESACNEAASKDLASCTKKTLSKLEKEAETKCMKESVPTCKADCQGKCEVGKMNMCLDMLKTAEDPGKRFCQDFWDLLHASAETDPVTGNPIALLSH